MRASSMARLVAASLGVDRHLELTVDLRAIGGSALTSDAPVPRDRVCTRPASLRPMCRRATPSSCRWRSAGRRSSARATSSLASTRWTTRAIPIAGPSSSPRSNAWRRWRRAPASRARQFRVHAPLIALDKAEDCPARDRARAGLRSDPQLLRPVARRTAVRTLRQLPAAREGLPRGGRRRSVCSCVKIDHKILCEFLEEQPLRRQVVAAACACFPFAAIELW